MINIFTDGSTLNNGKPNATGGIGIYIPHMDYRLSLSYMLETPTNQRCELYAILKALELYMNLHLEKEIDNEITIFTDSMYCINSLTKWLPNWKKLGWKTSSKEEIKNLWLIQQIDFLQSIYEKANVKINYQFIRAHTKEPAKTDKDYWIWEGNDVVDRLAKKGAINMKKFYK